MLQQSDRILHTAVFREAVWGCQDTSPRLTSRAAITNKLFFGHCTVQHKLLNTEGFCGQPELEQTAVIFSSSSYTSVSHQCLNAIVLHRKSRDNSGRNSVSQKKTSHRWLVIFGSNLGVNFWRNYYVPTIKEKLWQDLGKQRFCACNISVNKVVPEERRQGRLTVKSSSFQLNFKKIEKEDSVKIFNVFLQWKLELSLSLFFFFFAFLSNHIVFFNVLLHKVLVLLCDGGSWASIFKTPPWMLCSKDVPRLAFDSVVFKDFKFSLSLWQLLIIHLLYHHKYMPSTRKHVTNHWNTLWAALCSSRSPKGRHKYSSEYVKILHPTLWFGSSEEQSNQAVSVGFVWFLQSVDAHDVKHLLWNVEAQRFDSHTHLCLALGDGKVTQHTTSKGMELHARTIFEALGTI